jgi:triosephosphate isomerase
MKNIRRKLIVGNWKMNGSIVANAILLKEIKVGAAKENCDVAVCAPFPYLAQCQNELAYSSTAWGAQDVSAHSVGAYTGEVSTRMLLDFECSLVIVGHSERRAYHGENDEMVANKAQRALSGGLTPIVCVGETLAEREAGQTANVVSRQLDAVLSVLEADETAKIVVAYEPVWAIGTGKNATPEMAQEVHALLRARLSNKNPSAADSVRILYGGSMKPDNANELLVMPDIDGGLIGGASLNADDFLAIVKVARLPETK